MEVSCTIRTRVLTTHRDHLGWCSMTDRCKFTWVLDLHHWYLRLVFHGKAGPGGGALS